ncbi:hypothetical protein H632_c45p3 [Helicosporidium sp. ATCC 50920]|nr:hypothetical protein H632_c45p3 [Helicosporidium sp. ATCC 50920]|eukprot:KDD76997.1 hypothetical protein H632_c45p3 [Helicosporidium sp. ATCC 50920]
MDCTVGGLIVERGVPFVDFDSSPYEERFERIPSADATAQGRFLHLVYRRDRVAFNGANPTLLLLGDAAWFFGDAERLKQFYALVDAGFVLAFAVLPREPEGLPITNADYLDGAESTMGDIRATVMHLAALRYSAPGKVAVVAYLRSAGPLAALMNREPELLGAAMLISGWMDPFTSLAARKSGTAVDPERLRRVRQYSPFHGVREAGDYPPVLVLDVETHGYLNSLQSAHYGYRMQQVTQGKNETLLYLEDVEDLQKLEEVDPPTRFFPYIISHALKSLCPGWQAATGCL